MIERRIYPRVEAFHPAILSANAYLSPKVASTLDLGIGGASIETSYSLLSGTGVEMSLAICPKVIQCKGRVVHVRWLDGERLKAGLQFQDLSQEDRLCLEEYIASVREQQDTTNGIKHKSHPTPHGRAEF
jgi:hypothetical protein